MQPKISIIIPVYNQERFILRTLQSIAGQSYQDYEVIIINDGSKDNTQNIAETFARTDSRIRIFSQNNSGVSVARNKGIEAATGDYLMFVDGDDWLYDRTLEILYRNINDNSFDCVSYVFRKVTPDDIYQDDRPCDNDFIDYEFKNGSEAALFLEKEGKPFFYSSQQHIFKRKIIEKNNLRFAPGIIYGEDVLFARMYAMFIKKGRLLPRFDAYNYVQNPASCSHKIRDPWKHIIVQNIKASEFFYEYLNKSQLLFLGGGILAGMVWETLLHIAHIEYMHSDISLNNSQKIKGILYGKLCPLIMRYAPIRRKIMLIVFIISRNLFGKILGLHQNA